MKKKLRYVALFFLVITVFMTSNLGSVSLAAKPIIVKMIENQPETHSYMNCYRTIKKIAEEKSNHRLKFEFFTGPAAGTDKEMIQSVKMGTVQACESNNYTAVTARILLVCLPFLFKDYAHLHAVIDGPIGRYINVDAQRNGIKIIDGGWMDSGFRQITNSKRPINKPDDLRGLKMRVPPIETAIATMKALGASPTPIPYPELYMALKTKVVDGQENPFENIYKISLFETQKYLSVVNYIYFPAPIFWNLKWWNSLPADLQTILEDATRAGVAIQREILEREDTRYRNLLRDKGMIITDVASPSLAVFREKSMKVYEQFAPQIDKTGCHTLELIKLIQLTEAK